jgi:hypothetical protein
MNKTGPYAYTRQTYSAEENLKDPFLHGTFVEKATLRKVVVLMTNYLIRAKQRPNALTTRDFDGELNVPLSTTHVGAMSASEASISKEGGMTEEEMKKIKNLIILRYEFKMKAKTKVDG